MAKYQVYEVREGKAHFLFTAFNYRWARKWAKFCTRKQK